MKYFDIKDNNFNEALNYAAKTIRHGGIVAFPTETVYGLGADVQNEEAVKKIYAAKGRQSDNPLIVHIANKNDLLKIAKNIPDWVSGLVEKYWPGPLSIVLEKQEFIPKTVTAGLDSVAVRMPDNRVALELIKRSGRYIAAPSANKSGKPSPTKAEHVLSDLHDQVDVILDYDNSAIGLESTVIDGRGAYPVILRPGAVTLAMLKEAVGNADKTKDSTVGVALSPGMKYVHYKPNAEVIIVNGAINEMAKKINTLYNTNKNIALFSSEELAKKVTVENKIIYKNTFMAANLFYDSLRKFDQGNAEIIVCQAFAENGIGTAIMNRLKKAAGNHYL
jgi:L-threonylcarbamoyladenylate synthase